MESFATMWVLNPKRFLSWRSIAGNGTACEGWIVKMTELNMLYHAFSALLYELPETSDLNNSLVIHKLPAP